MFNSSSSCPSAFTGEPTPGTYQVIPPTPAAPYALDGPVQADPLPALPTALELLRRIERRMWQQGPGEFSKAWEMARHRCLVFTLCPLVSDAKLDAQFEAQRAALAQMSR